MMTGIQTQILTAVSPALYHRASPQSHALMPPQPTSFIQTWDGTELYWSASLTVKHSYDHGIILLVVRIMELSS